MILGGVRQACRQGRARRRRRHDVIDGERLEALYVVALTTGLRRGERLALRWDDIDLGSRQLRVRRAMQRVDGKLRTVEVKTSSSRRTVVLPRLAVRHLQEHKKRQDGERLALGDAWREHGPVFASTIGTPIEPRNVNRRWDELRRKAGLDWLRLHDLRHGYATFLQGRKVASDATFRGRREDGPPGAADSILPRPQPIMNEKAQVRQVHEGEVAAGDSMCHRVLLHRKTA